MEDDHSDKIWDEYDWERFLQEQEKRTDKYMELLEKYLDHPQRDEIISREMGWAKLQQHDDQDWEEEVEAAFEREFAEDDDARDDEAFSFQRHPLYQQALALTLEADEVFEAAPQRAEEHPAAVSLMNSLTIATAKLAAALNDDGTDELGMSIAYLKRALFAMTSSLGHLRHMQESGLFTEAQCARLTSRVFAIREGIVDAMGGFRAEFRRRHGY